MFQGTGSDVGKSLIVAGLCRALTRRGLTVRPFKPQNMSNNAAVTIDGGEIGRAQALQARACGVAAHTDFNPVLLKPQGGNGSQIVVHGQVRGVAKAADYQAMKPRLMGAVIDSFERLRSQADIVLVEGAGSASEINLRIGDIANMGFARQADVPVVLIGDIDRGGVIAALVGTEAVVDPQDGAMICGFLVNRFRGDPTLFDTGMAEVEKRTGWPSFGLVPHFEDAARLPAEDALALRTKLAEKSDAAVKVAMIALPSVSNFDDLDPLIAEPDVSVLRIGRHDVLPVDVDCVILPGSKATLSDLSILQECGLAQDIVSHYRRGGHVFGLCGGYQMLGRQLIDSKCIEGGPDRMNGLGLLEVETVLADRKRLVEVSATTCDGGHEITAYEMHMGRTDGPDRARPFSRLVDGTMDGAYSADRRVIGTYLHGVFANDAFRRAFVERLGGQSAATPFEAGIESVLDGLANHLEKYCDIEALLRHAR
ncbi:cobyric acid synthase [Notoacmeibacter sp. MSK16QG-6]|uniref:cobyric acid synthase n=1 Tax=Notoacmeibacter sp. MSK16QG-6 TaxID=2957982 RepID=UPI00209E3CFF|nr:cobyric acid synthase [Notoacmeibacter sp. MSK16QG-6]MCP1199782.1 cobyric acid synthase [Notoacmeibacter sp. MSK16QG-6]